LRALCRTRACRGAHAACPVLRTYAACRLYPPLLRYADNAGVCILLLGGGAKDAYIRGLFSACYSCSGGNLPLVWHRLRFGAVHLAGRHPAHGCAPSAWPVLTRCCSLCRWAAWWDLCPLPPLPLSALANICIIDMLAGRACWRHTRTHRTGGNVPATPWRRAWNGDACGMDTVRFGTRSDRTVVLADGRLWRCGGGAVERTGVFSRHYHLPAAPAHYTLPSSLPSAPAPRLPAALPLHLHLPAPSAPLCCYACAHINALLAASRRIDSISSRRRRVTSAYQSGGRGRGIAINGAGRSGRISVAGAVNNAASASSASCITSRPISSSWRCCASPLPALLPACTLRLPGDKHRCTIVWR